MEVKVEENHVEQGRVADPRVGGGGNVLLVLVIVTFMLGGSLCAKSVIKCLIGRIILTDTSRVPTWERNRTPVLFVAKTFHRKLTSCYTYGVYTRERSPTSVLCVGEGFV